MESRKAPHLLTRFDMRAIVPSIRSENTKAVMTSVPTKNEPRGKKHRAPATTPSVPTSVTASGLTPQASSVRAIGVKTRVKKARA
jgi:hypothetical protein